MSTPANKVSSVGVKGVGEGECLCMWVGGSRLVEHTGYTTWGRAEVVAPCTPVVQLRIKVLWHAYLA